LDFETERKLRLGSHLIILARVNGKSTRVLIDNGSEVEAVDPSLLRTLNIPMFDLTEPIPLYLADGTLYYTITQAALLNI
jgi:predicted aspartyl protease